MAEVEPGPTAQQASALYITPLPLGKEVRGNGILISEFLNLRNYVISSFMFYRQSANINI